MTKTFCQDEGKYMDGWTCKSGTEFSHGHVLDVYYQTTLDGGFRSMRPRHDIARHPEATRLAMAVHALKAIGAPRGYHKVQNGSRAMLHPEEARGGVLRAREHSA